MADLDQLFHALSDPTRRAILDQLSRGPATVGSVAAPWAMSLPAVSRHVRVLEDAGLLRREVRGRTHILSLAPEPLRDAESWLAARRAFWEGSLDRLAALVTTPDPESP